VVEQKISSLILKLHNQGTCTDAMKPFEFDNERLSSGCGGEWRS